MALGALVVKIGADFSDLTKATSEIDKALVKAGKQISKVGEALTTGLTLPIAAAGAGMVAAAINVGGFADELLDLVDQTGISAETLQEFRHVALAAGVESDALAQAAIRLTTQLQGSGEQTAQVSGALEKLGLSATNATTGGLVPMEQLLPSIIEALSGTEDVTLRNALAGDIFGRSWAELAPVLALGSEGMAKARGEAQSLGLVMSTEALNAADAFRAQVDTLKASMGAMVREIGMAVLPILIDLTKFMTAEVVPAVRAVIRWFDDLSPTTKTVIGVVAGLAAALGPLLVAIGSLLKLLPLLKVGLAALSGPIGLTITALAALVAAGVAVVDNWNVISFEAKRIWEAISGTIKGVLNAIVTKFTEVATAAIRIAGDLVKGVKNWLVDQFMALVVTPISNALKAIEDKFKGLYNAVVGHSIIPDMVRDVSAEFGTLADNMGDATASGVESVKTNFGGIRGSLTGILDGEFTGMLEKWGVFKSDVGGKVKEVIDEIAQKWGVISSILTAPDTVKKLATDWVEFFGSLADAIRSFWGLIKDVADKVRGFFLDIGGGMGGLGGGGFTVNVHQGSPGAGLAAGSVLAIFPENVQGWLYETSVASHYTNELLGIVIGQTSRQINHLQAIEANTARASAGQSFASSARVTPGAFGINSDAVNLDFQRNESRHNALVLGGNEVAR